MSVEEWLRFLEDVNPLEITLTDEQIVLLLSLKYSNGEPIIDSLELLHMITGLIHEYEFTGAYSYLSSTVWGSSSDIIKNSPLLSLSTRRYQQELINYRPLRTEGFYPCKKCTSENTFTVGTQTRAGDEPLKQEVFCNDCGYKFIP